jgi:hypothetical protein
MKNALIAIILLSVSISASATVIPFSISGSYTQGGSSSDITATTISVGGAGSFVLDPGFSGRYFDFSFAEAGGGTFSTIGTEIGGYYFLDSYNAGETVGLGDFGFHVSTASSSTADDWDTILVADATAGVWDSSHSGYLGFQSAGGYFGWIEYDFVRDGSLSTISFLRGAYNDVAREDIAISAVPEPATIALMGLGLAGIGFARKKKQA